MKAVLEHDEQSAHQEHSHQAHQANYPTLETAARFASLEVPIDVGTHINSIRFRGQDVVGGSAQPLDQRPEHVHVHLLALAHHAPRAGACWHLLTMRRGQLPFKCRELC